MLAFRRSPLISVPQASNLSGRARVGFSEINRVAAHPDLGVPLEQIKAGLKERDTRTPEELESKDLVTILINENKDLWDKLLDNPFCEKMRTAAANDQDVLKGFKWYMVQDFHYCIQNMNYEADRSARADTSAEFVTSVGRVSSSASYAHDSLSTCTTPAPDGLGISDWAALHSSSTQALTSYTDFQITMAQEENWVLALVAMIPCIQSYYQLAIKLQDSSVHKDTVWYKLWTEENAKYGDSTVHQKEFFIQNYDSWKDHYEAANRIFRRACQGEIDLWATALDPVQV